MAVRYDPVLIAGIVDEIRLRYRGHRVLSLSLRRERREVWILLEKPTGGEEAMGILLHPTAGFIVTADVIPPAPGETDRRIDFRRLYLVDVWAPADERLLVFDLAGGLRDVQADLPPVFRLHVELHTNQWNAVLARGADDRVEAVLWQRSAGGRSLRTGAAYQRPEGARAWADAAPHGEEWKNLLAAVPPADRRAVLLRSAAWTSSLNVDWILGDAAADGSDDVLARAFDRYASIRVPTGQAWLVPAGKAPQPYPATIHPDARPCESLLEGMRIAAGQSSTGPSSAEPGVGEAARPGITPEAERLRRMMERRAGNLRKRRASLLRQLDGESADHLREIGNLLLARKKDVPKGASHVLLTGFDGQEVAVSLDPRRDAVGNAEILYDRAGRRERAACAIPDRVKRTDERISRLDAGLQALRTTGATDELWDLIGGRTEPPGTAGSSGPPMEEQSLPYRRYRSSGGFEIRVGRSSRGNDTLTFRHSAPDDIWLHARQAAGAHVILRWEKRDQNPPLVDLTEAAVLAALHSEARHSGLVAVDWTRRKHVRKPRKAAPGAVVPERVSTLFVEPDAAITERLRFDD